MLLQEQCLAADVQHLGWCGAQARAGEANRQVFLLLRAANSAPLPRRGWRPSARQSKLNVQMCLCSKYLSPAGYHLSSWWCLGTFPPKGNEPLLMQCERPTLLLLHVRAHNPPTKFHKVPKRVAQQISLSCGLGKAVPQARLAFCFSRQAKETFLVQQTQHYCHLHLSPAFAKRHQTKFFTAVNRFSGKCKPRSGFSQSYHCFCKCAFWPVPKGWYKSGTGKPYLIRKNVSLETQRDFT